MNSAVTYINESVRTSINQSAVAKDHAEFLKRLKIQGMTLNDYLVLVYLASKGEVSSYQMMCYLEGKVKYAASYCMLRKLEKQGILRKAWGQDEEGQYRNFYSITILGKIVLDKVLK